MKPEVSVIIPTYKDWADLERCLSALGAQDAPPEVFEIVVANNAPGDAPPPGFETPRNARIVPAPRPGSYAARNVAVEAARGDLLFFTDSDCMPAPDWISRGLAAFQADPDLARLAGQIELAPASGRWNGWSLCELMFSLRQEHNVDRGGAVTANLAVRRSVFDRMGAFRETAFSGEDLQWNLRASREGVPLAFDPDFVVRHDSRETLHANLTKARRIAGSVHLANSGLTEGRRRKTLNFFLPSFKDTRKVWQRRGSHSHLEAARALVCRHIFRLAMGTEILRLRLTKAAPNRR